MAFFKERVSLLWANMLLGSWADPEGGVALKNHKLLYVFFEMLVQIPLERQLDLSGPIASRWRSVQPCEICK